MSWHSEEWEFETERLRVMGWRTRGVDTLSTFLVAALTDEVTRELPPSWQGGSAPAGVGEWIVEREREGQMFLVEAKEHSEPVGVFMFFPGESTQSRGEVRVGYVLVKSAWGRGYATELLQGFVRRWDEKGVTASLLAGVTVQNVASQRVLEKAGFSRAAERNEVLEYQRFL